MIGPAPVVKSGPNNVLEDFTRGKQTGPWDKTDKSRVVGLTITNFFKLRRDLQGYRKIK